MAKSCAARFDSGSSGEGLVPPSAAGMLVLAGIQFSGWGVVPGRGAAPARKRGAGAVVAALGANDAPFSRAPRRPAGEGRMRAAGEPVCGSPHLTPAPGSRPGQALSPQRAEREIQRAERGKLECGDVRCGDARRAAGSWGSGRLVGLAGRRGRLAAIRGVRSAAPVGHRRADQRNADQRNTGLASVERPAATNFVTSSRRRVGQILPQFGHIYTSLPDL
jgi:hypothetical protein